MDNFKIIYKILSVLEKSMDLENVDIERISSNNLGISQQRWHKYMEMLLDAGYIKGVTIQKYVTGETNVDAEDIRITLKGLEYLSENSIMQKMYKAAKGITDLIP
jgi:YjcQ protein.